MMSPTKRIRSLFFSLSALVLHNVERLTRRLCGKPSPTLHNYSMLEPNLYIGGQCESPPPGTSVVLNLSPRKDSFTNLACEWHPLHPGTLPTLDWLRDRVQFIDIHQQNSHTVFIHCDAGIDRSALVVIAFLMRRDHCSRDDALDRAQRKRPIIRPNPAFMQLLARWEQWLAASQSMK